MVIVLLTVAGRVAHMAVAGRVAHRAVVGKVAHMAAAGMVARMVAGEAELSMQTERDMVQDKLGVGVVLQDILLVLGKLRRQRMATVLALKEHTGHQFYPPSCSSGRHKTINEGKTHQQKQGNKD
jgi:hypothetical protein